MSYRFCFGPSGAGKTHRLIEEVTHRAQASLLEDQHFLYIVPEQYTMQTQKDLVLASPSHGIMNVDVLSFGRLSHRIFEEVGADPRVVLDDVGKSLILQRLAGSISDKLQVLGRRLGTPGMIAEVKSMISEFMQYGLEPSDVSSLAAYAEQHGQNALARKLQDLQTLYEAFLAYKKDHFLTGEETLDLLAEAVPKSELIRHSVLIFDGFTGFTPVQYRVLEALMQNAEEVIFSVTIAEDGGPSPADCEIIPNARNRKDGTLPLLDPQDLFYLSRKTIRDICIHGERAGAEHAADLYLCLDGETPWRFRNNAALAHFEGQLFRYPLRPFRNETEAVSIVAASTVEEEVRQVCIRIHELVRTRGYEYRDIGIVAGDLDIYGDVLQRMAAEYDIPVYVDRTRAIRQNPLTEAISSALEIAGNDYSYATVFRYLRSGLSSVPMEQVDRLENYCLAHGINSLRKWKLPFDAEAEPARQQFLSEMAPLTDGTDGTGESRNGGELAGRTDPPLAGGTDTSDSTRSGKTRRNSQKTAQDRTLALYQFLVNVGAEEKMQAFAAAASLQDDVERAQEYDQIYGAVIRLLDQIYSLLQDTVLTSEDYLNLLQAGFDEIRLGTLPQRVDRILVGDIERTRMSEVKVLFFLGVNDGIIPKGTEKGGLISDLDREFLDGSGIELSPTPREEMYIQRLYLYLNMTRETQQLILSYAAMRPDGSSERPSYLIQLVRSLFPAVAIQTPEKNEDLLSQVTSPGTTVRFLADGLRDYASGILGDREEQLLQVYAWCTGPAAPAELRSQALERKNDAFIHYEPDRISPGTAARLYGRRLIGSVSRFETAVQCYRKHFLSYGLHLQERDEYTFESADAGTVLHESLAVFSGQLEKDHLDWRTFSREEAEAEVRSAVTAVSENYRNHLLTDTSRSQAGLLRAERVLLRTVETLQYQLQQGEFTPAGYEVTFGDHNEFRLALPQGGEVVLHGRIDRVDLCEKDGTCWIKIIDYKTGSLDLDAKQILQGLRLQLIVYMNAELRRQKGLRPDMETEPAALLYYRFQDPILQQGTFALETKDQIDAALLRQLRPQGMVNESEDAMELLDHGLSGGTSLVIPVGKTKKGTFTRGSKVFSREEYQSLSDAVQQIIINVATQILQGNIAADPAILPGTAGRTACTFCPYANVCGFDPKTPGYHYWNPDPLH